MPTYIFSVSSEAANAEDAREQIEAVIKFAPVILQRKLEVGLNPTTVFYDETVKPDPIINVMSKPYPQREVCGEFPNGYALCEVLETYGDGSRMKCRYVPVHNESWRDAFEFYAKRGLGSVLQVRIIHDIEAFKRGEPLF